MKIERVSGPKSVVIANGIKTRLNEVIEVTEEQYSALSKNPYVQFKKVGNDKREEPPAGAPEVQILENFWETKKPQKVKRLKKED